MVLRIVCSSSLYFLSKNVTQFYFHILSSTTGIGHFVHIQLGTLDKKCDEIFFQNQFLQHLYYVSGVHLPAKLDQKMSQNCFCKTFAPPGVLRIFGSSSSYCQLKHFTKFCLINILCITGITQLVLIQFVNLHLAEKCHQILFSKSIYLVPALPVLRIEYSFTF